MGNSNKLIYFERALKWIRDNTIHGSGITVTSKERKIYPEVTGYYIPSLLQWGEQELAKSYALYLCSIQNSDGSWCDPDNANPYVFDSAQILKGLLAIREWMPEVDDPIIQGCEWILSNMQPDGRLTTPCMDAWGKNEDFCSELVHLYCLSPIKEAGTIFHKPEYLDAVEKILAYYKKKKMGRIKNFSLLSHFYAYVMEGLFDLGEVELCRESMNRLEKYRNKKNGIPGLRDVPWVCSTGLFQLALVWYKLGELEKGNSLFYYGLSLQNPSGGWYGSYPAPSPFVVFYRGRKKPYYFPKAEISWANKYFLDALALKERLEFEKMSSIFMDKIDDKDGRYLLINKLIQSFAKENQGGVVKLKILDAGCGKGRYLKQLFLDLPDHEYYAMDISSKVMNNIEPVVEKRVGSLTNIPFHENTFDMVYTCEALEHGINNPAALRELFRVVKPGGILCIIDKPKDKLGKLKLYEWEQWIKDSDIREFAKKNHAELSIKKSVPYEGKSDGLFRGWVLKKH